mmetsp:Transcript_26856/g.75076  ORF Transcript_26856/g.75076 Transcript_26856/m.75076 type:complete len:80 (+) Transcript_26856:143-382(+)
MARILGNFSFLFLFTMTAPSCHRGVPPPSRHFEVDTLRLCFIISVLLGYHNIFDPVVAYRGRNLRAFHASCPPPPPPFS